MIVETSAVHRLQELLAEGLRHHQAGHLAQAKRCYRQILAAEPHHVDALHLLGFIAHQIGRQERAVSMIGKAISVNPSSAIYRSNLGNALKDLGRRRDAVVAYRAALCIKPDSAEAHSNLAATFLAIDCIQFCRYAPLVAERGGRVILEVHRPLIKLATALPRVDMLVAAGDPLPEFSLHCPLMSLPRWFGTTSITVPPVIPFAVDGVRVADWQQRLQSPNQKIDIVWQGNPKYRGDRDRSVPLALFAPLAKMSGVRLISLQKQHGLEQLEDLPKGMTVETLGADFDEGTNAFLDTAAVMMSLDLIVTVDTAVGHLAGTLGRPVWVVLATSPHWVWLLDRDDTPWYPTMRLFRQKKRGDWQDVFDRVAARLRAMTVDSASRRE